MQAMKFTPKKSVLLLLTIIFLLLAVQVVSAASQSGNIFDSFKNIFGSDFGQLYKDNWWIVDLIVYLFFFGYIGKLALGTQFQGKGGSIGIIFGVALAIALVVFEAKTGFQLGNLGPYAMAVLVLALAFITWKFFHGLGMGKGGAAAFAVVVIYGTLATVASPLLKALRDSDNSTIQMFASIIDLLLLIAVIAVAWNGFSFVFRLFKGGESTRGLREAFTGEERAHRQAERIGEAEAGQIANVEQYESRLDEFARKLGKAEIKDEKQFREELQKAIQLAEEAESVEIELEAVMQEIQQGKYGDKARKQVDDLRKKYADYVNKLFKRVQDAERFARRQRQELQTELKELLAASQADQRVHTMVGNLSMVLGNDRARFISDHNLTGQVKADIEKLDATIKQFQQLEQQKAQVLRPAEREINALSGETDKEIMDLDNIMAEMRSLARLGQLRKPQLYAIVQQLKALLQMGGAKQHGIQQAQDIINRVRQTDKVLKQTALLYRKLQADVLSKLGRGVAGRSKQALTAINRIKI